MMLAEFGSTGASEISVFQRLEPSNGTNPFRLVSCPTVIPLQVPACASAGKTGLVAIAGPVLLGAVVLACLVIAASAMPRPIFRADDDVTPLTALDAAEKLGLVTFAPDDIDWDEEIRIATEERASFSPDALTGLEANYRFAGPETMETKIFGRLSAWQNWIFNRPNASGPDGALRRFGTGQRAVFDRKRV